MRTIGACLGVLFLVPCFAKTVEDECQCHDTWERCFSMCETPNECTDCNIEKENCNKRPQCEGKRGFQDWKSKLLKKAGLMQDETEEIPFINKRLLSSKFLMSDFLTKREKAGNEV